MSHVSQKLFAKHNELTEAYTRLWKDKVFSCSWAERRENAFYPSLEGWGTFLGSRGKGEENLAEGTA